VKPDTTEIAQLWIDIEDHLIPFLKLDAHLRSVYYHLARRSRVVGERTVKISIDSLAQATGLSTQVRQHIRTLEAKGALKIVSRDRTGTTIEVYLPSEIPGCVKTKVITNDFDLESYDFYTNPVGRRAIIEREGGRCFYCLRQLNSDSAVLDNAIGQLVRRDNSYRNIVACCHECNSLKSGLAADDFIRTLYRRGRLNAAEMEDRLSALGALQSGDLKPVMMAEAGGPDKR
jgi:hypothetical protein